MVAVVVEVVVGGVVAGCCRGRARERHRGECGWLATEMHTRQVVLRTIGCCALASTNSCWQALDNQSTLPPHDDTHEWMSTYVPLCAPAHTLISVDSVVHSEHGSGYRLGAHKGTRSTSTDAAVQQAHTRIHTHPYTPFTCRAGVHASIHGLHHLGPAET